jgi:hypothetical protein
MDAPLMNALGMLALSLIVAAWIVTILLALIPEREPRSIMRPPRRHVDTHRRPYDWQREPQP